MELLRALVGIWTLACIIELSSCTDSEETVLLRQLLSTYPTRRMPKEPGNETLTLRFGLSLYTLDIGEGGRAQMLTWERYSWRDHRLEWDPAKYGDISILRIEPDRIWTPESDFYLYNSVELERGNMEHPLVLVYNDGRCLWVPRAKRRVVCDYTGTGTYECMLKYGSWTRPRDVMDLDLYNNTSSIDLNYYHGKSQYSVSSTKLEIQEKVYPCCPDVYPSVKVTFTATRRQGFSNNAGYTTANVASIFIFYSISNLIHY